jgi:hypothetical protein
MSDHRYVEYPLLFHSSGITARLVPDTASPDQYLALTNCEELAENALAQRLGSVLLTANGNIGGPVFPLSGIVRSLFKLGQLQNIFFRYAVTSDGSLWRISGLSPGEWTKISSKFSGNPCSIQSFSNSDFTSTVSSYFADSAGMFKDTGTQAAPSQLGIFPPQFPALAAVQVPDEIVLDPAISSAYTTSGVSSFTPNTETGVSGNITSAITSPGLQEVAFVFCTLP